MLRIFELDCRTDAGPRLDYALPDQSVVRRPAWNTMGRYVSWDRVDDAFLFIMPGISSIAV